MVEGEIRADLTGDIAKLALVKRHSGMGGMTMGLVSGFRLTSKCAIASTVVHDSHHLIIVGTDDESMAVAANSLAECGGGQVVVKNGKVIGRVELKIAGLMADERADLVAKKAGTILKGFRSCGCQLNNPNMQLITASLQPVPTIFPVSFTDSKDDSEKLWDVRRGLFPAVGGARKIGTTVIIEDVAFPIERLANATLELERLLKQHGYREAIIFGHALDGNLHFVFTQDFRNPEVVKRYQRHMDDVCSIVVRKYDGSLKGEHGTGRNMAPFVELEWGEKAYKVMKRIKRAFDPYNLLNTGVLINDKPAVHLDNLKPLPKTHEIVDKCIECGFCEVKCPSRNLTTTPRQRIVIQREISRLRAVGETPDLLKRLEQDYEYVGEQTVRQIASARRPVRSRLIPAISRNICALCGTAEERFVLLNGLPIIIPLLPHASGQAYKQLTPSTRCSAYH